MYWYMYLYLTCTCCSPEKNSKTSCVLIRSLVTSKCICIYVCISTYFVWKIVSYPHNVMSCKGFRIVRDDLPLPHEVAKDVIKWMYEGYFLAVCNARISFIVVSYKPHTHNYISVISVPVLHHFLL